MFRNSFMQNNISKVTPAEMSEHAHLRRFTVTLLRRIYVYFVKTR